MDTNVSDFLRVRKLRALESKIIDSTQSMLVNSRSLIKTGNWLDLNLPDKCNYNPITDPLNSTIILCYFSFLCPIVENKVEGIEIPNSHIKNLQFMTFVISENFYLKIDTVRGRCEEENVHSTQRPFNLMLSSEYD